MFHSLRPHEPQHTRPPCPSPTPGVHWDSCPSSQWCHPAISSSVVPFSSCPQSFPASESLPMSQLFSWGHGKYKRKKWKQWQNLFPWAPKSLWMVTAATKLKMFGPWKESYDKPRQYINKQRCHFADKGQYSQSYGFSSSHVQMWNLDHKEGWMLKNWCFQIVVLEETPESPSDCKEIKPVNPKGNQPWIFTGRTDAEVEAPIFWPPDMKSPIIGKDSGAGKAKAKGEGDSRG